MDKYLFPNKHNQKRSYVYEKFIEKFDYTSDLFIYERFIRLEAHVRHEFCIRQRAGNHYGGNSDISRGN